MNINAFFQYDFLAVGQGLFASGRLLNHQQKRRFDWIHDCGTSGKQAHLDREIEHYGQCNRGPVNLLCLSHFDEDHISGARKLLTSRRIDILVMPYYPLVDRMQIALDTKNISPAYLQFLIDPAAFMIDAAGENLGEIILIAGGKNPPEEPMQDRPTEPREPNDDKPWDWQYPENSKIPNPDDELRGVTRDNYRRTVLVFTHQKPFTVGSIWEFMFYNKNNPRAENKGLRKEVIKILAHYRNPDGTPKTETGKRAKKKGLLDDLKKLYVKVFGKGGKPQNAISLITYSGPMMDPSLHISGMWGSLVPATVFVDHLEMQPTWYVPCVASAAVSIGYFGDFPLDSLVELGWVRDHFKRVRWDRFQLIQIPHHGSSHSWYNGASREFNHGTSVISSARHSKHHPSQKCWTIWNSTAWFL
jgi:hypothetical protein